MLGPCPGRAGGFWEGAGQVGDKLLANMVVAFENRVWGTICTIGHYLKLFVFLNARIKREVQIAVRNRGRCWCLTF